MRCVDRKTSQSYTTIKVEPYKRECAPAICPPGEGCSGPPCTFPAPAVCCAVLRWLSA